MGGVIEVSMYVQEVSIGTIAAAIVSWTTNHSIGWAIFHGLCSWFYVIYWAFIH